MEKISFKKYLRERIKHKVFIGINLGYLLLCLASVVFWGININIKKLLVSLAFIFVIPLIFIAEYITKIRLCEPFTASLLALAFASILGSCFNLYIRIPILDTLLHVMSGMIFCSLGFAFAERFFGRANNKKSFFGCLVFAICFSLAISLVWEVYEYVGTFLSKTDMMADSIVTNIKSGLLSGIHAEALEIEGITQTVIYFGDGQTYIINGYLDIGLIDTLTDMVVCAAGTLIFAAVTIFSYIKFPKINKFLIPQSCFSDCEEKQCEILMNT